MGNFRYGFRMLTRSPVFAMTAILCAALGTGATTAIFSVVNAVLLRPLPYAQSDRLVRVFSEFPKEVSSTSQGGFKHFWISPPEFFDLKRDTQSWDAFEAWANTSANISGQDQPVRVTASYLTGGLLDLLAVPPALGRLINPDDDRPNIPAVADLSYDLWQRAFGGDPKILGRDIRLDGSACTVVGVMPRGFNFPPDSVAPSELWSPLGLDPAKPGGRGSHDGAIATSTLTPSHASATPKIPPKKESSRLSVRNWRKMRPRPAPRAARIATSVWRDAARANSSAATLAQAINNTNPTAACSSNSGRFITPNRN
jgi:hypothetical protein